jgi:hypothetical protein
LLKILKEKHAGHWKIKQIGFNTVITAFCFTGHITGLLKGTLWLSLEHLNPVVAEVDDVDEALVRDGDATWTVELARLFPVAAELSKEYAVT